MTLTRSKNLYKRWLKRKIAREKRKANKMRKRPWIAGRLITINHRVYRMKSIYKTGLTLNRCTICKILNHHTPCNARDFTNQAHINCFRKSDLSCIPVRIR